MPASTAIIQQTGPSGTPTQSAITNLRFASADAANSGTTSPIAAPGSGSIASYFSTVFLNANTAPTTSIVNVKFYMNGTNPWTGATLQVGTVAAYTQATGTSGAGVALNTTNYAGLSGLADGFSYTAAAPLALPGTLGAAAGKAGQFLALQLNVSSIAVQGVLTGAQAYIQYDES